MVEKLKNILQIRKNTLTNLEKWYNFGKLGKIHKIRKIPWKTQGKCKWDLKKKRKKRPSLNFDWWIQKNTQHLEKIFQTNSENKLRKILRITRKNTPKLIGVYSNTNAGAQHKEEWLRAARLVKLCLWFRLSLAPYIWTYDFLCSPLSHFRKFVTYLTKSFE